MWFLWTRRIKQLKSSPRECSLLSLFFCKRRWARSGAWALAGRAVGLGGSWLGPAPGDLLKVSRAGFEETPLKGLMLPELWVTLLAKSWPGKRQESEMLAWKAKSHGQRADLSLRKPSFRETLRWEEGCLGKTRTYVCSRPRDTHTPAEAARAPGNCKSPAHTLKERNSLPETFWKRQPPERSWLYQLRRFD